MTDYTDHLLLNEIVIRCYFSVFYHDKSHNFFKKLYLKAPTKIDLCPRDLPQSLEIEKCQYVGHIK